MAKEYQSGRQKLQLSDTSEKDNNQTNITVPFPDEEEHLNEINAKLEDALTEADTSVDRLDKDYMDLKLYMVQNRGDIDPHEMFQNELALNRIDHSGAFAVSVREKLSS